MFSFSNNGLIAVQFFNSILLVYYKTVKKHKTVTLFSYSLFQFEGSGVISVLKTSIGYSFVFFKCLIKYLLKLHTLL